MSQDQFDYIVVGAGAAGSVVAARLSEDSRSTVLLLEEGPSDKSIYIRTTGGYFKTHGTDRTFLFHGEPEPAANNRSLVLLQGRTMGGGTSINSMCYSRGQHADYDDWARLGCAGWSAKYLKAETLPGAGVGNDRAALADYVLNHAKTALHPVGTCAMGADESTVVDLDLKVRGVEGLRVVDGSVIPIVPRGNTTAPIMMVAEKAADLIRGRSIQSAEAA